MLSVFCSNTLIFAPECWKCTIRCPDFKLFPGDMPPDFPSNLCFQHLQVAPWVLSGTILSFLYRQLQSFCHLLKTLLKTLFHTFNHYLLIAWYYVHLARNKSETLRLNAFITFFWKLKFSVKEKLLLKPETKSNTEMSGPPCAFLICIVTSRVNEFKYVLFFVLLCFSTLLVYILHAPCINRTVSTVFFFPYLSYMANLFYYSMYLINQRFHAKEGFYYSIVQVIKVIINFQWFWYKSHVCILFIHVNFMQINSFTIHSWRFTCFL